MRSNNSLDSSLTNTMQDLNFSLPKMNGLKIDDNILPRNKKVPWGFDGYKVPLTITSATFTANRGKFNKAKLTSFIDDVRTAKSKLPPAFKYKHITDWSKMVKGNKGKFFRNQRKTITEDIAEKQSKIPSPDKYETSPVKANLSIHKYNKKSALGVIGKEVKRCGFFDEAQEDGLKSPSHIYNTDVTKVKPRLFATTIYKGKNSRIEPIVKRHEPAPGLYDTQTAFHKTQLKFSNVKFGKTKKEGWFDKFEKASKRVPGVGAYKQKELAFDKLSKSPRANRSLRR